MHGSYGNYNYNAVKFQTQRPELVNDVRTWAKVHYFDCCNIPYLSFSHVLRSLIYLGGTALRGVTAATCLDLLL